MPRILLTNDDGVYSEGLHALADALRSIGDVTVVAPLGEASAIGHALTIARPLRLERLRDGARVIAIGTAIGGLFAFAAIRLTSAKVVALPQADVVTIAIAPAILASRIAQ